MDVDRTTEILAKLDRLLVMVEQQGERITQQGERIARMEGRLDEQSRILSALIPQRLAAVGRD